MLTTQIKDIQLKLLYVIILSQFVELMAWGFVYII